MSYFIGISTYLCYVSIAVNLDRVQLFSNKGNYCRVRTDPNPNSGCAKLHIFIIV